MCEEVVVAEILYWHLQGTADDDNKENESGFPLFHSTHEPCNSRIRVYVITTTHYTELPSVALHHKLRTLVWEPSSSHGCKKDIIVLPSEVAAATET
jgi:hypothetical protein